MLGLRDHDWSDFGGLKWDLSLCLLAAWLIVGLCLIKGVQSSGKVVYFTALFPYFVLFILMIRGGSSGGALNRTVTSLCRRGRGGGLKTEKVGGRRTVIVS